MEYAFLCKKGVKDHNEDSILVGNNVYNDIASCGNEIHKVFAVADGVSGNVGGEIASNIILETLKKLDIENCDIKSLIKEARKKMIVRQAFDEKLKDMSSTLSVVLIDDAIKIYNLGDSPIYITKFGSLRKVSYEDSLYHEMLKNHLIEENDTTINRHIITKYIHPSREFEINEKLGINLSEEDYILITSDGISDVVPENIIENVITSSDMTLLEKVNGLYQLALKRGSTDNISAILIKI